MTATVGLAELFFLATLIATFSAAFVARRHSARNSHDGLDGRNLNRWLIGLSAATTANSGFIVTGAVGLGYTYGVHWAMLPLAWFAGDLLFWRVFPARINAFGHATGATTLSEVLTHGATGWRATLLAVLVSIVILCCLAGYTSAQWLAGEKFLAGAFGLPSYAALVVFALLIICYSSIGGFRGSVYADAVQAGIRIAGTLIALLIVSVTAWQDSSTFRANIEAAGPDFLNPFPGATIVTGVGFVLGFGAAAIGFGLGQPQILSRYLAGRSPEETRSAQWIYLSFVCLTWLSMTVFGVLLRGVMPGIADPEAGLSVFFRDNFHPLLTGIIAADIFATIASTSNGLLVAMTQGVKIDLLPRISPRASTRVGFGIISVVLGGTTMYLSTVLEGNVMTIALSSLSLLGAAIAPAVMFRIMGWRHSIDGLFAGIGLGLTSAIAWKMAGFGAVLNEAAPGIVVGMLAVKFVSGWRKSEKIAIDTTAEGST